MGKKRSKGDDGPGIAPWVVTYGDMMSLLLTFFILLAAFSTTQKEEFNQAMSSFRGSVGILPFGQTVFLPYDRPAIPAYPRMQTRQSGLQVAKLISWMKIRGFASIHQTRVGLKLTIQDSILFPQDSAELIPGEKGVDLLEAVAGVLLGMQNSIPKATFIVEGHTDDVSPTRNSGFRDDWELSAMRARAVVSLLTNGHGLDPRRFIVQGGGKQRPAVPNDSIQNRAKNNRVEIQIVTKDINDFFDMVSLVEEEIVYNGEGTAQ